jgi:exonuclease SbcC
MIFSALTFALFGEAARSEQHPPTLRSDHADPGLLTEVDLVFEVGAQRYRILRRPEQMRPTQHGRGETKELHKAWLFDVTDMDLEDISDRSPGKVIAERRVRDVNTAVEELLGYGATQFRQIVLLPQGRFETFLAAKTDDRLAILRDLFDVSLYRNLAAKLKEEARLAEEKIRTDRAVCAGRLRHEGFETPEALAQGINEAGTRYAELSQVARDAKARLAGAQTAFQTAAQTDVAFKTHVDAETALARLESESQPTSDLERQLKAVRIAKSLTDVDTAVARARQDATAARVFFDHAISKHRTAANASEVVARELRTLIAKNADVDTLRNMYGDYQRHERTLTSADELRGNLSEAIACAQTDEQALLDAKSKHSTLLEQQKIAAQQLRDARANEATRLALELKAVKMNEAFNASHRFEQAQLLLTRAHADLAHQEAEHASSTKRRMDCEAVYLAAERALLQNHALHLAGTLVDGEPCPVCGGRDHPAPAQGTLEGEELQAAYTRARRAYDAATNAERQTKTKLEVARSRCHDRDEELSSLCVPECSATDLKNELEQLRSQIEALASALSIADVEATYRSLEVKSEKAQADLEGLKAEAANSARDEALARQSLEDALKTVPRHLRAPNALKSVLARLEADIQANDKALSEAQSKERVAREVLIGAERDQQNAALNWDVANARLKSAELEFSVRLSDQNFTREEYEKHKAHVDRIEEFERRIRDHAEKLVIARDRARKAADAIKNVDRPDIHWLQAERDLAAHACDEAQNEEITARERVKTLEQLRRSIGGELERLEKLESTSAPLRELARVLSGQSHARVDLETYAITAMFDQVLDAANLRLRPMTHGRYSLVREGEEEGRGGGRRGLGICVDDTYTGRQRAASTLSGGETFIAALALALGLSDIVESVRGNVQLDAIFIDEGFGSLDSDSDAGTLEQVLQSLQDLVGRNRAVGLISHVPQVQQAIPNGFWITKSASGSHIEVRH